MKQYIKHLLIEWYSYYTDMAKRKVHLSILSIMQN